jgi:hypothetical protein
VKDAVKPGTGILDRASAAAFGEVAEEGLLHGVGGAILPAQNQRGKAVQLAGMEVVKTRDFAFEFLTRNSR